MGPGNWNWGFGIQDLELGIEDQGLGIWDLNSSWPTDHFDLLGVAQLSKIFISYDPSRCPYIFTLLLAGECLFKADLLQYLLCQIKVWNIWNSFKFLIQSSICQPVWIVSVNITEFVKSSTFFAVRTFKLKSEYWESYSFSSIWWNDKENCFVFMIWNKTSKLFAV